VAAPTGDAALRAELEALPDLWEQLHAVDPVLAARLHPNDRVRLVRGLEVWRLTGTLLSALHAADPKEQRAAEVVWVDREDLYAVIDRRVEAMMAAGYLGEVERLLAAGREGCKPMQTLGYRHLTAHLQGRMTLGDAVRQTQADTREFARKQRSFLRSLKLQPVIGEVAARAVEAAAARAFGGVSPDR
jgi:tRNA dimethylallyltransferase